MKRTNWRKYFILSTLFVVCFGFFAAAKITPTRLRCEYLQNPQAVDVANPRLSWVDIAQGGARGQAQTAWEIRVASTKQILLQGHADLWGSGKVMGGQCNNIYYGGNPLPSRQDCWWQVRVWDVNGNMSGWSEPAYWGMGLLTPGEWKAQWIGAPWQGEDALPKPGYRRPGDTTVKDPLPPPAPLLRKSVNLNKQVASAKAYVTGLGYFEFYVNGNKVSDDVLVPNLTLYGKRPGLEKNYIPVPDSFREYRVMYLCYNITAMLKKGENVFGAILGNGFYNAPIRWTQSYGTPRFLGQIYITYTDGTEDVIVSDGSWKASKSPIVMDLVYGGEHYDARLEQPGWCTAGFDDAQWQPVVARKAPEGALKAHMSPTDKVMELFAPVTIKLLGEGRYRVDFGKEISGWLHLLNITGKAGQTINIKYISESPVAQ